MVACTHQRHAIVIAMCMAYSLYLQCLEGGIDPNWKVALVPGQRFWQKLSHQMEQYKSSKLQYPRDAKMLKATQMSKNRHGTSEISPVECDYDIKRVSYSQYFDEKVKYGGKKTNYAQTT